MKDKVTEEKIEKYRKLTSVALKKALKSIIKSKETEAKEIMEMVSNYLSDSKYFEEEGDLVNAFAALNYAHGWLDSGVRLGIFDVDDDNLFTVR